MAYSELERTAFAHELARSGGNIAQAVKALREEYESFGKVGESTLRRWLKTPGAVEAIAAAGAKIARLAAEEAETRERARIRRELAGTDLDKQARDEAILDDLRGLVKQALDEVKTAGENARLPIDQIARLYERLSRIHDNRALRTVPVLSGTQDCQRFIQAFAKVLARRVADAAARAEWLTELREAFAAEMEGAGQTPAGA